VKLSGAEAVRYFAKPDPARAGLLIFGADPMRVALRRQQVIRALIGPEGEAEMRLTRMAAGDLRRDPAALLDALKAQAFFPGPRAVFVEDATETTAVPLKEALADWQTGDAVLVVTAGGLTAKSALKKLFDDARNAVCIGLYDDPPGREEIEGLLAAAGLRDVGREGMAAVMALARDLDPGDFRQTVEKIGLYKWGDATPLTVDEVAALAPATIEAEVDDLVAAVAEGQSSAIGPLIQRLAGQGTNAVTICIGAMRYFRGLHKASCDPAGVSAGIAKTGGYRPRHEAMARQAGDWGTRKLEQALAELVDTDLTLRSAGQRAPAMAVMERALIRVAMIKGRR
jgi:DNA polymerase III subunit delta